MSLPTALLTTKLYAPRVERSLVTRPRLVERLDAGVSARLTIVAAPAGFGKTTLVNEWITHAQQQTAWLSLDSDDNDLDRFLLYLAASLQRVQADLDADLLAQLQSPQPPPLHATLGVLLNALASRYAGILLVLDDYHLIRTSSIHAALTYLIDHLPPTAHIVLTARESPPLPLARWRARGQLRELQAADLRFTSDETNLFLNERMTLKLSAQDMLALSERTEGWIVALRLAALALQGRDAQARSDFIRQFSGTHVYIADYLVEEALQRQNPTTQEFLLETSILKRLCAPLCDALTGRNDGQEMLEQLQRANLFLFPLDDERHWFRYHHLFADVLRQRLEQNKAERVLELHRRAAEWHADNGETHAAIEHAMAAQDFEHVARLIEQKGDRMWTHSDMLSIDRWIARLPDEVLQAYPKALLLRAWAQLMIGQAGAEETLQRAESILNEAPRSDALPGIAATIRAVVSSRHDAAQALEQFKHAAQLLPADASNWLGAVHMASGFAYLDHGDLALAERAFADAAHVNRSAGNIYACAYSIYYQGRAQLAQGRLRDAGHTYQHIIQSMSQPEYASLLLHSWGHLGMSAVAREQNDLTAAAYHALDAIRMGKQRDNVETITTAYMLLARAKLALGEYDEATALIQEAARRVDELQRAELHIDVREVQVRLWLAQGQLAAAIDWATTVNAGEASVRECILLARVALAQGRAVEADAILSKLLASIPPAQAGIRLELQALRAVLGQRAMSLLILQPALAYARVEGYRRVFLDEGPQMIALLQSAATRNIEVEVVQSLLSAGTQAHVPTAEQAMIEPLGETELEVLQLLALGLSNEEIAKERVVAVSTIKWHLKNIYGKLGVRNRTAAVARGKSLNLL